MMMELSKLMQIWVPTNCREATPDIVTPESDLYLRRLWGDPNEVHTFLYNSMASRLWENSVDMHAVHKNQAAVSCNIYSWL
ncbi:LOW QUALITY PROTEIN: hypothetical protein YC2023_085535 [Brassica napus]